jgi:hypothetical protein
LSGKIRKVIKSVKRAKKKYHLLKNDIKNINILEKVI